MSDKDAEGKLLELLDRNAFEPVLNASPDDYSSESDRKKLRDVQEKTKSTQQSYHKYGSAEKVREMFRDDLSSDAAQKVHRQLKYLGLPTLDDIKPEFEKLADDLGVGR